MDALAVRRHEVRPNPAARSIVARRQTGPVTADHYFSAEPAAPAHRSEIEFSVAGRDYRLAVASGVFSAGRLDPGTAVLLKKGDLPTAGTTGVFLDLGCGYGPIAAVLASEAPQAVVYAVDVNSRARELTVANAATLGLGERVRVAAPDEVPAEVTFDQIWSNPPTHIGKTEMYAMLDRWLPRLTPDGAIWLVINRHLGGDSLHSRLVEQGWQVERKASQKGYRVLRAGKKTN